MGRRLSVLLAALHEPEVLLLDEPFDGVDPIGVEATLDVIADARARGACVLVSTHLRELAIEACGEVLVLRGGRASRPSPPPRWRARRARVPTVRSSTRVVSPTSCAPSPTSDTSSGSAPGTVRRRTLFAWAVAILAMVTVAVAIVPAFLPGAGDSGRATEFSVLIPTAFAGFVALADRVRRRVREVAASCSRATRPSRTRSARPPTTSARC